MPNVKEITVYQFEELSESAKQRAREWFAQTIEFDAEYCHERIEEVGKMIGITFDGRTVQTMGGKTRTVPDFSWDIDRGAFFKFSGSYEFKKGFAAKIRKEFKRGDKHWEALFDCVDMLVSIQRSHGFRISASINGDHYRSNIYVQAQKDGDDCDAADADMQDAMETFAHWAMNLIRMNFEWEYSAECIDDNIIANEYEFDEDGNRA